MFSSRSFMVPGLIFKSLIHFSFFLWWYDIGVQFHFYMWIPNFPRTIYWKDCLLHWVFSVPLSKISWPERILFKIIFSRKAHRWESINRWSKCLSGVSIYIYVYVCVCVYISVCVYIYTHTQSKSIQAEENGFSTRKCINNHKADFIYIFTYIKFILIIYWLLLLLNC